MVDPQTGKIPELLENMAGIVTKEVFTVIDNATFAITVTGDDIDFSDHGNLLITNSIGDITGSPTMTVKVQTKDSNGNYIDYDTMEALSTGNESQMERWNDVPASTIRVVATLGGSGEGKQFENVTLEATLL